MKTWNVLLEGECWAKNKSYLSFIFNSPYIYIYMLLKNTYLVFYGFIVSMAINESFRNYSLYPLNCFEITSLFVSILNQSSCEIVLESWAAVQEVGK